MTARVLMVCAGNICRSPMAEAVFQDRVNQAGLGDQIGIDSAGTGGWHAGEPARSGTLRILKSAAITYNGRARQVHRRDIEEFDCILAMDRENLSGLWHLWAHGQPAVAARVRLFLSDAKTAGMVNTDEVPDPYYDDTFPRVYDLVSKGADALLARIRIEHGL